MPGKTAPRASTPLKGVGVRDRSRKAVATGTAHRIRHRIGSPAFPAEPWLEGSESQKNAVFTQGLENV